MEWLNQNSGAIGVLTSIIGAIVAWFVRIEVRLSNTATKTEMETALNKIYDLLRPMGENIARLTGRIDHE